MLAKLPCRVRNSLFAALLAVTAACAALAPQPAHAAAMTDYLENKLVDQLFRGVAYTFPTQLCVALYTVAPTDSTAGTEVSTSGTGYGRQCLTNNLTNYSGTQGTGTTTASSGTNGTTYNNVVIAFGTPTAAWGTVVAFCWTDAVTGGNELICNTLTASKTVNAGDSPPSFAAYALSFQIDN